MTSVGVEIEMPVADRTSGAAHKVKSYFENIRGRKSSRGESVSMKYAGNRPIGVKTDLILTSLDNAFNNLESSIGPVWGPGQELTALNALIEAELRDVHDALADENAMVLNFSEHPLTPVTTEMYEYLKAPKPIYDYWVDHRKWNHKSGIDAKAHNGPTTGVSFDCAVDALNVVLGASPAFIAMYANSPFEDGKPTGRKENRLTIWPRMLNCSRFPCDARFHGMPQAPFRDLIDYFQWMFGPGSNMQYVASISSTDYKEPDEIVIIEGDPPLLEFLKKPHWTGRRLNRPNETVTIVPGMRHMELQQFAHFLDARIRYKLIDPDFPVSEFLEAWAGGSKRLEELFGSKAEYCYIEGRAPGANFPDETAPSGADRIAKSIVISPSAIQKGLIENPGEAKALVERYGWPTLRGLREEAIERGLQAEFDNTRVTRFCGDILETAARGLDASEHWMLAYPQYVLSTGKTGADRALEAFDRSTGSAKERIRRVTLRRRMTLV